MLYAVGVLLSGDPDNSHPAKYHGKDNIIIKKYVSNIKLEGILVITIHFFFFFFFNSLTVH